MNILNLFRRDTGPDSAHVLRLEALRLAAIAERAETQARILDYALERRKMARARKSAAARKGAETKRVIAAAGRVL